MSIWGDLFGDTQHKTENLLTGQQERVSSGMVNNANRLQDVGRNIQATDVRDPGYEGRFSNLKSDVLARADREAGNVRHSSELHSTSNMMKQANVKQGANNSLAGMEQQNLNDQLRQQEQANVRNEFLRKQYFNQSNQLRAGVVGKQAMGNIVEQTSGLHTNVLSAANTGLQLAKLFGGA